jgi:hypothetical protein
MTKLALMAAAVAVLGFTTPSFASDSAAQGRIQLAQANFSVSVGDRPAVRSRTVIRESDRGYRRGYRQYGRSDNVVIVKKRKPARKTVIIER